MRVSSTCLVRAGRTFLRGIICSVHDGACANIEPGILQLPSRSPLSPLALEHYFEMAKTDAQQALDIYKRFCAQTEKIVAYMQTARKVSTSLNLAVPNLRHAPVSLAGALKEYLDDPNFEKNRLEYKESKRVADTPGPKAPKQSAAPASANDKDKQSSTAGKSIKIQEPTAEEKEKHVKLPTSNQAIQDFFESIDTDQNQMSMFGPQQQMMGGNSGFMMPQMTGMPGLAPQMTGYNPFYMQQQPTGFMQPQQTSFIQQQPTGFGMPSHNQSFLQPQMTGFNPFRQSAMPSQMTGVGGFGQQQQGMSQSPHSQPLPPPQHGAQDLQSTGPPSALDSFNSAFGGYRSASGAQVPTGSQSTENGNGSASPLRSSSAPLSAQKTGSRNPFAPPPGSTPPPKPAQLEKKGPSLYELAFGSSSGMSGPTTGGGGSYGLGAGAWSGSQSGQQQQQQPSASSGLAPQKTGLLGNVASEFVGGHAAGNTPQSPAPVNSPPQAPGNGDNTLSAGFSSLTLNGPNSTGQPSFPQQQQQQQLQPQPTGFGGSEVQPFKPESSFGQTLAANGGTVPSPIPAHLTGNPFAKVGNNSSSAANAGDGQPGSTEVAEQQTAAPTNLNGSSGYSQPASQATGFGNSLFASNSNVGSTPTSQGFQAQPSNFGSSLFSSAGNQSSAPAPFGSPQQQQQQGFQNGGRAPQPTGLGGSTVRPFQPSSAFGTSTFGAPGDTQSSQPQLPQQTQAPFQTGVPTGALF